MKYTYTNTACGITLELTHQCLRELWTGMRPLITHYAGLAVFQDNDTIMGDLTPHDLREIARGFTNMADELEQGETL